MVDASGLSLLHYAREHKDATAVERLQAVRPEHKVRTGLWSSCCTVCKDIIRGCMAPDVNADGCGGAQRGVIQNLHRARKCKTCKGSLTRTKCEEAKEHRRENKLARHAEWHPHRHNACWQTFENSDRTVHHRLRCGVCGVDATPHVKSLF